MSGPSLPMPPGLGPDVKLPLDPLDHGVQLPGIGHGGPLNFAFGSDPLSQLGNLGTHLSNLLDSMLPGNPVPFAGLHGTGPVIAPAPWNGESETQGPPWAGVPHEGHENFEGTPGPEWSPNDGPRTWNNGEGNPGWDAPPIPNDGTLSIGDMVDGIAHDPPMSLGLTSQPVDVQGMLAQTGELALHETPLPPRADVPIKEGGRAGSDMPMDVPIENGVPAAPGNRVALDGEAISVDRQITAQRPGGAQQNARAETGADAEIIEWRGGSPTEQQDQPSQIDPRLGWMNRVDQGALLKLSLTVIPPVLREGETTQSATRTALFRAVVNGQQAFIDSQGRIVGWTVRHDLPATYVANVIHPDELMQLPDGRQAILDSQGRQRSLATGEILRSVKAVVAADSRLISAETGTRTLIERTEARLHEIVWSTALTSCIGLLLVVAAFLSAAIVGAMPWIIHVLFLAAALGLAVFCARTWKRLNRLPGGSVTKLPAITRRIRLLMALSCSAQGAGAVLLGTAAVLF